MGHGSKKNRKIRLNWAVGETGPDCMEEFTEKFGSVTEACRYMHQKLLPGLIGLLLPLDDNADDPGELQNILQNAASETEFHDDALFILELYGNIG